MANVKKVKHPQRASSKFTSAIVASHNARAALAKRQLEAMKAGDQDLARALAKKRLDIGERELEITAARDRYFNSTFPEDDNYKKLLALTKDAKKALKQIEKLNTALVGATKLVNLLVKLAGLF